MPSACWGGSSEGSGLAVPEQPASVKSDPARLADKWRASVAEIPSRFGRLVYLSSLLDEKTAHHEVNLLTDEIGAEPARFLMRDEQRDCFAEWLTLTLREQAADLDVYFQTAGVCRQTLAQSWLQSKPYGELLPPEAVEAERRLFLSDLEAVLESMVPRHEATPAADAPALAARESVA